MTLNIQQWIKFICGLIIGSQITVSCAYAEVPAFTEQSIYSLNQATVSTVDPNLAADLVILDGGLEQGLRLGMVCRVERGTQSIGELIIIESRSKCSAALILNLTNNFTIQSGDVVRIKTLQNS